MRFHRSVVPSGSSLVVLGAVVALVAGSMTGAWAAVPSTAPRSGDDSATGDLSPEDLLLEWGSTALKHGRFTEAEARFNEVLNRDWNNPRAYDLLQETRSRRTRALRKWLRAARKAEATGDPATAMAFYRRIVGENPRHTAARKALRRLRTRHRAQQYVQSGLRKFILRDYTGAQLDFEQALAIDPTDSLAAVYREQADQSIGHSSSLADLRADQATWQRYLEALKKFRAGDLKGAEDLWRGILEKYPGNDAVQSNLEQVARRQTREFSANAVQP